MNMKKLYVVTLLALMGIGAAQAFDFLYIEGTYELVEITRVEDLDTNSGLGNIFLAHEECPQCATEMVYSSNTLLRTATGQNRPIQELGNWTGYSAMVVYRLPDEQVLFISIFPPQN